MSDFPEQAAEMLQRLRGATPRVHCLMNTVVHKLVADGLSALGAIPSMTYAIDEVSSFVAKADALVVNLGTLDDQRRQAIRLALDTAHDEAKPWVLDPAHCDYSPPRATFAQELLALGPAVLRANASEFVLLSVPDPVVGVRTGASDLVRQGERSLAIENGHALTAKVTGTGCLSGAIIAAFLAVERDALQAAAAAMLVVGVAAEIAGKTAQGPGSFEPAFLDALDRIGPAEITTRARVAHAQS
ncbi:MAG: hydroxyethylthiazole kinase [Neoaquamicrobium sediminum]|uniref:hydroxyethylthiazole kinase n=1 Tax=Neoaquamicrobium sediminum TaxID=1849104 RepID=UPI0040363038